MFKRFVILFMAGVFVVLDCLFLPFYLAGRLFEILSSACFYMSDTPGMTLTRTWHKKMKDIFWQLG